MFPEEYNFFPKTWILPNELNDLQFFFQQRLFNNTKAAEKAKQSANNLNQTMQSSKNIAENDSPDSKNMQSPRYNQFKMIPKNKQTIDGFTMIVKPD